MVTPLCLQPFCFTAIIPVRASCWYGERCGECGASSRVLANEKFSYAMPVCCVPYCRQSYKNGAKLYRFPANPERKAAWVSRIKRPLWEPTSTSRVCGVSTKLSYSSTDVRSRTLTLSGGRTKRPGQSRPWLLWDSFARGQVCLRARFRALAHHEHSAFKTASSLFAASEQGHNPPLSISAWLSASSHKK